MRSLRSSLFLLVILAAACAPQLEQGAIHVSIIADGAAREATVPAGSTAREALESSGLEIGVLDRSEPPFYTVLSEGASVRLVRVLEEFEVQESVLPYETQILRNDSLPEGERRLIQPGVNGALETTLRRVIEDGVEVSSAVVKTVIIQEAVPEIVMVGSQSAFAALPIPGRLSYLSGGNAWVMEGNTGARRPIVTSGDLDGRIFSLSPDGAWLLYTRSDPEDDVINTLWVARADGEFEMEIDLGVENVVHFAGWVPDSVNGVAFSTVDPIEAPPGWQANNDLKFLNFSANGWASGHRTILGENSGGVYGWWGISYAWSPDGEQLAYARPDGVGLVDFDADTVRSLLDITPLLTRSDWAWMTGLGWSPDGRFLYIVDHAPQQGLAAAEESPLFDLKVVPLAEGVPVAVVPSVGMFAYPQPSPIRSLPSGEDTFWVAYLEALSPTQSDTSGYRLMVMDRDGSNKRVLFPAEGAPGLQPQRFAWSPAGEEEDSIWLAYLYQGNLWLVDVLTGQAQQLTGDGLATNLDWK